MDGVADVLPWIVGANALLTFGQTAYMLLSSRGTKALQDIKALADRLDKDAADRKTIDQAIVARINVAEQRLLQAEADIKHLPDRDQFHRMEISLAQLSGSLETLDERLKPVAAISERLQEFLLEQAKK